MFSISTTLKFKQQPFDFEKIMQGETKLLRFLMIMCYTRCNGTYLQPQDLEGWGKKMASSGLAWSTQEEIASKINKDLIFV